MELLVNVPSFTHVGFSSGFAETDFAVVGFCFLRGGRRGFWYLISLDLGVVSALSLLLLLLCSLHWSSYA